MKKYNPEEFLVSLIQTRIEVLERQKEFTEKEQDCTIYAARIDELKSIEKVLISHILHE